MLFENPLPVISVKTDVDSVTFLQRLEELLPEVPDWQFRDKGRTVLYGREYLLLTYIGSDLAAQPATDLICRLFGEEQTNRVKVQVAATSWAGEKLDYATYVAAAKLFRSVLKAYNAKFRTRRRLRIPSEQSLEPRLASGAQKEFHQFLLRTSLPHGGSINNETWEALYEFIHYAHSHNLLLTDYDFGRLLVRYGCGFDEAEELATMYLHGRNLLHRKRPWDHTKMCAWLQKKERLERARQAVRDRQSGMDAKQQVTPPSDSGNVV